MKSEKSKQRLQKIKEFFKKYPVIITLAVILPVSIYTLAYFVRTETYYYHYYYDGEYYQIDAEEFKLTGIKKVANVYQAASAFSYQGGACYEEYYAVVTDNFEAVIVYNTKENMKVEHVIDTNISNTYWHCNQMFFGPDYFSVHDKFPILYISMEHPDVNALMGFRIYQLGGEYFIKKISQFTLYFDDGKGPIYYPNAYYDFESKLLYYVGYTKKSYYQEADNYLRYYAFTMPDYRTEMDGWFTSQAEETFELPSETACQGGCILDHYLYQTFSFASKTDPIKAPKMKVIDLVNHEIVYDNQNLGAEFGVYQEFEHVAINSDGKMYSLGNPFNIYEFTWTDESPDSI